jgi:hypothetical protein
MAYVSSRQRVLAAADEAASQALGHCDLSTTLGIYGHQDQRDLERAMEALARIARSRLERRRDLIPQRNTSSAHAARRRRFAAIMEAAGIEPA